MSADSSQVDAALVAKLLGDTALMAITSDGVYFDEAPDGKTRFVIVQQHAHEESVMQPGATAFETFVYLVKAVTTGGSGADVSAAALRIQALLHFGTLTPTGYSLMSMERTERIRYAEVDDKSTVRWQHRGGLYQVMVSPN